MTPKHRLESTLRREPADRIPTFEWFIDPGVGEALTGSRDLLDIIESLDIDGVNIRPDYRRRIIDDNTFSDEWGTIRQDTGDVLPAITTNPITDLADHAKFTFPDPTSPWRFESLEHAVERFGDERAVILNVRDGFSDLRDLLGYEEALVSLMSEPDDLKDLLARVVDFNLALARTAKERYGVTIIATTDDVAFPHGLLINPEIYHDILAPAFREVISGFKSLGYLTIKHSDGDVSDLIDFWIDAGIDCLDPIDPRAGLDLADIKQRYGDKVCLKGNVDCAGVLQSGTTDQVKDETRKCIEAAGEGGGYICSSSNTIHRGVKPENYRAMLDELQTSGWNPPQG